MSLRRGGTPLAGAIPSLEASNQAQIDDLVQRNRTLEHLNKKLTEQVGQENARSKEAVQEIQRQWDINQLQWKDGCEEILASYRVVQRRVELELELERSAVIREMKITREEKLRRLQRDYKIKLFQMKEEELERTIEEMEEEKAYLAEEYELALRTERERNTEQTAMLKDAQERLAKSVREKDDKDTKYTKLIAQHSNLEASKGTLDARLQRTQLQMDGLQIKTTDLERVNDELKRSNGDLTRQLERWQNLETKGGEAAEKHHKERIALELELRELKEEFEAQKEQDARDLEKANKRLEKQKNVTANYETESKEQAKAAIEANKKVAKLQKLVDKLKEELEEERARVRPPSPQKVTAFSPPIIIETTEISDGERPTAKQPATTKAGPSRAAKSSKPALQVARKTTGGKAPHLRKVIPVKETASEAEEDEEEPPPSKKARSKAKEVEEIIDEGPAVSQKRAGKRKAVEDHQIDDETEEIQEARVPRKRAPRRKLAEENESDDEIEIVEKPKAIKKNSRALSEVRETTAKKPSSKRKDGSRASSKQPASKADAEADEEDDDAAPKKKKRKMIFPVAKPPGPFAFDSLQFDNGGLNIPSILSPVRPNEIVPQRSTSASLMNGLGNIMKLPFRSDKSRQ